MNRSSHQLLCLLGIAVFIGGFTARRLHEYRLTPSTEAPTAAAFPVINADVLSSNTFYSHLLDWLANAEDFALEQKYQLLTTSHEFRPNSLAAANLVLWRWAELNGEAAYRYAQRHHEGTPWDLCASPAWVTQRQEALKPRSMPEHPRAALRWALNLPPGETRARALPEVFDRLTTSGFLDLAIAEASRLTEPSLGDAKQFLAEWSALDPARAGKWFGNLQHTKAGEEILAADQGYQAWIWEQDHRYPAAMVIHTFEAMNSYWGRDSGTSSSQLFSPAILANVTKEIATQSPQEALRWLTKLSPALLDTTVITGLVSGWSRASPDDALRFLLTLPSSFHSMENDVAPLNLPKHLRPAFIRSWAEADPEEAANWILLQSVDERPSLMEAAHAALLRYDPEWVDTVMHGLESQTPRAFSELILTLAQDSPESAAVRLLDEVGNPEHAGTFHALTQAWFQVDPERSSRFVASLDPGPSREGATRGLVESLLHTPDEEDLKAALAWTSTLDAGVTRTSLVTQLVNRWAVDDPLGARDALERLNGDLPAYEALGQRWYHQDPSATIAWITSLTTEAAQDAARVGMIEGMRYEPRYDGTELISDLLSHSAALHDEETRLHQMKESLIGYQRQVIVTALEKAQVAASDRAKLLDWYDDPDAEAP